MIKRCLFIVVLIVLWILSINGYHDQMSSNGVPETGISTSLPQDNHSSNDIQAVIARLEDDGWEKMVVVATAYTAGYESTGKHPGHPAYGITYSGAYVLEGRTLAVDPKVIPLGSKIRIPILSPYTYIAEDIGGAIKGNRIDIYMDKLQDALNWGVRTIEIWVKRPI